MSTDNDHFLDTIVQGNILGGLEKLSSSGDGDASAPLALNRLLYGAAGEEQLQLMRDEEARLVERLEGLADEELATAYYNLGCFSLVQDDIVTARDRFNEAVRLAPRNLMARHNLAYAHELMAETDQAREHYQTILAQKPDCPLTRLNLAQLRVQEEDLDNAVMEIEDLQRSDRGNRGLLLFLSRALLFRGGKSDAETVIQLLTEVDQLIHYPDLYECLAYALFLFEDYDEAEKAFTALLDDNADNHFARMGLIKILGIQGKFKEILTHVEIHQGANPTEKMGELLEALKNGP